MLCIRVRARGGTLGTCTHTSAKPVQCHGLLRQVPMTAVK